MTGGLLSPRALAAVATLLLCGAAAADSLPVRRVVVFKNGLGFLTRSGPVAVDKGSATIDEIPPASYGTLWIAFANGSAVTEVVAESVSKPSDRPASGLHEILAANAGAQVTLTLRTGGSISGTILAPHSTASRPTSDAPSGYVLYEGGEVVTPIGYGQAPAQPGTLMLESGGRFVALGPGEVLTASFASRPRSTIPDQKKSELLRIRADSRDGQHELTMSYLTQGIGWTPEYALEIRPDGTAAIVMRAMLINDSIDLVGSDVLFAVGYPSFTFAGVPTPLDVRRTLARFFEGLRGDRTDRNANAMANVMRRTNTSSTGRLVTS